MHRDRVRKLCMVPRETEEICRDKERKEGESMNEVQIFIRQGE